MTPETTKSESTPTTPSGERVGSTALFAFFRDKSCAENLSNGRDYYAAGIVTKRYDQGSVSGKDLAVTYLDPYTGYVESAWRADGEIEIYEVDEWEWKALKERYDIIEANAKGDSQSPGQ